MRILLFTPLHPDYGIRPQTLASILALRPVGPLDIHFRAHDNPARDHWHSGTVHMNVTYQHNRAREMVLAGDYDALLSVEADMIIPPDALERLAAPEADIAYGLYAWRHRQARWSAYSQLCIFGGVSLSQEPAQARAAWGTAVDVAGLGMGCTLIHRHVLEHLRFELLDGFERMLCDDWILSWQAQIAGYRQVCDLGCVCGHMPDAQTILWPDPAAPDLVRKEQL